VQVIAATALQVFKATPTLNKDAKTSTSARNHLSTLATVNARTQSEATAVHAQQEL